MTVIFQSLKGLNFYNNLNWFFSRFYVELHFVWDFLTKVGEESKWLVPWLWLTEWLGPIMLQSGAHLDCLLSQFENEDFINNRFARCASNATKWKLRYGVPSQGAMASCYFLIPFSFMFCFYKRVVVIHPIHPSVQRLQNTNCSKTDLNFTSFVSEYNPLFTIQAVMHEITADPAVFSNCTLGWNRWHIMNCQQIHLQMLTCQIRSWSGTPGTVIPKKRDI